MVQNSEDADNIGGGITLWYHPLTPELAVPIAATEWTQSMEWNGETEIDPGYYFGTETGNGLQYSGLSDHSNTVEVV